MAKKNKSDQKTQSQRSPIEGSSPLEEQLTETALGAWILEHKTMAISIVAAIFLAVLSYGGFVYYQSSQAAKASQAVYVFEQEFLEPYVNRQVESHEVINEWRDFVSNHRGQKSLLPVLLFISDELIEREELQQAVEVLSEGQDIFRTDFGQYFIGLRLAVAYEDLGRVDQAIDVLEKLERSSLNLMDEKVYLDLGRLYLEVEDYERARMSFEHVTESMAQEEFVSLARAYLAQIDGLEDVDRE